MVGCLAMWFPRCGQLVASVMKAQAPLWTDWILSGRFDLQDYACYLDVMGAIEQCGP